MESNEGQKAGSADEGKKASGAEAKGGSPAGNLGEVEHTPIIVDGGSAQIDFSSVEYNGNGVVQHTSAGLFLRDITCLDGLNGGVHSDTGSRICHTVQAGEVCQVVFNCKLTGHQDRDFTIEGGSKTAVSSGAGASPAISFDEAEYPQQAGSATGRRVHANQQRKIVGLKIFTLSNGQKTLVHDCPLIPPSGKCKYQVADPHVNSTMHHHKNAVAQETASQK